MNSDSEITELVRKLQDGEMTLGQVADRFRHRRWPRTKLQSPSSYLDLARRAQDDPRPDVPGSFDEVVAAYDLGQLSREQYRVLKDGAMEGMRAQDREGGATG